MQPITASMSPTIFAIGEMVLSIDLVRLLKSSGLSKALSTAFDREMIPNTVSISSASEPVARKRKIAPNTAFSITVRICRRGDSKCFRKTPKKRSGLMISTNPEAMNIPAINRMGSVTIKILKTRRQKSVHLLRLYN